MKLKFLILLASLCLLSCGKKDEPAPKAEPPNQVHVTQFGEDYHRRDCELLEGQGATMGLTAEKAVDKGYLPCEQCQPPRP